MKDHWIVVLLILIGAALFAPAVSAQIVEEREGYVVSTADDIVKGDQLASISSLVSGSISQGQLHSYSRYVYSGTTSIISDLNWGDTADSLSLTLVAPDITLGPYYDSADGWTDGRIYLIVSKSSGLPQGTWWNRVYGSQVTGSQDYTFESF
jgi:hypothetical protein|nr:peptidase domain-containing protein [uncultured Methanoregula sp.]